MLVQNAARPVGRRGEGQAAAGGNMVVDQRRRGMAQAMLDGAPLHL